MDENRFDVWCVKAGDAVVRVIVVKRARRRVVGRSILVIMDQ